MTTGRRSTRFRSQRASALLELALSVPMFLVVIYGIWVISNLARAQYHVAMVTHAVTRMAAAGVTDGYVLSQAARRYARTMGMNERIRLVVDVEQTDVGIRKRKKRGWGMANPGSFRMRKAIIIGMSNISPGVGGITPSRILGTFGSAMSRAVRVQVVGIVPVGGPLKRLWRDGVSVRCSSVCLPDPWKSPFGLLRQLIRIPGV